MLFYSPVVPFENSGVTKTNYDGYRSKFFGGDCAKIPRHEKSSMVPAKNFSNEIPPQIHPHIFDHAPARFEDLATITKKDWVLSADPALYFESACFVMRNLKKKGSAVIALDPSFSPELIMLLAYAFETVKITRRFVLAEKFDEANRDPILRILRRAFDCGWSSVFDSIPIKLNNFIETLKKEATGL